MQLQKMAREWFRLASLAHRYGRTVRFDAVAVAIAPDGRVLAMEHVRDAF
jgi:hypothetical protein